MTGAFYYCFHVQDQNHGPAVLPVLYEENGCSIAGSAYDTVTGREIVFFGQG